MDESNPYAPPKISARDESRDFDPDNVAWRDGRRLMVRKNAVLPDRCVLCNEPAAGYQYKRSLSWASPWWAVSFLLGALPYIIVYLIVRRRGRVTVGVCPTHRRKRKRAILIGWLLGLTGFFSFFIAGGASTATVPYFVISGVLLILVGLLWGTFGSIVLVPVRIDKHFIWLNKVSPDYLASFPDAGER